MTHAQKPLSSITREERVGLTREERVALALRENLAKRKQQARARQDQAHDGDAQGAKTVRTDGDTKL